MNNLESPTGLKQRLIRALGGYNLMDPRSPSQVIARTPLGINKKAQEAANKVPPIAIESMFDTTLDISFKDEDPYRIFEDEQPVEEIVVAPVPDSVEIEINESDSIATYIAADPRSPTEGVTRTPLAVQVHADSIEEAVDVVIEQKKLKEEDKQVKSTLLKSMYKDLIRRDPIYLDLLQDEDDELVGKTTPVKKVTSNEGKERTPLGCLGNRNLFNSTPIKGSAVKHEFSDNFCDKIDRVAATFPYMDDENTPVNEQSAMPRTMALSSKSKIPIRARRI